jgi:hypothetical protein
MHHLTYPALCCAMALFYAAPLISNTLSNTESAAVQPLSSVAIKNNTSDWKQANKKVAELGGWQFYTSEAGGHQTRDHSGHSMPMDHSKHSSDATEDNSGHLMPIDHSKHNSDATHDHSGHTMPIDHSKHSSDATHDHSGHTMPMDHSKHSSDATHDHSGHTMPMDHSKHQQQMDHSEHLPATTGDKHEHHH